MHELFTVVPPGEALAALLARCSPVCGREITALARSLGRVCSQPILSSQTLPAFARSTMDGYAVRSSDTHGASESSPAYLRCSGEVLMGQPPACNVGPFEAVKIHTGAMLPPGADAVVMIEETNAHGAEIEVLASAAPGENLIAAGEDIAPGVPAVPAGRRLRAADLGGLAALGEVRPEVFARPRVAVLSTGDEVVPADVVPGQARVRDVNAYTIAATIERAGGIAVPAGIAADDEGAMLASARSALAGADALVMSAGSSVSVRDLTARVIAQLGAPGIFVHGIAIKPGKPTILAMCDGKPVIGLPGNPASALVVAWRIVGPLVRRLGGEVNGAFDDAVETEATLTMNVPSRPGREDYVPAALERDAAGLLRATPLFGASNLIFTLVRATGLIVVPLDRSGIAAGERARVIVP